MWQELIRPTFIVSESKTRRNIQRMAAKALSQKVVLRPHFKTHQSAIVGEWFREEGITAITVSSVEMAEFFAGQGWDDITIAFPLNPREIGAINQLAAEIRLGVLVEAEEIVYFLEKELTEKVRLWVKVDAGYGRTGIFWDDRETVRNLIRRILTGEKIQFAGILSHFGNTYQARKADDVEKIFRESLNRLEKLKRYLEKQLNIEILVSIGDTPGCSICNDFYPAKEIRPGNFVYYDVMQYKLGSCREEDIAVGVAAPVVAVHPQRETVVVHAGAVHLSKESLMHAGRQIYGWAVFPSENGWRVNGGRYPVIGLSQEHGIVHMPKDMLGKVRPGDVLVILPVHSCLTANLLKNRTMILP